MFGEFLLQAGIISSAQLDSALETQRFRPRKLGRLLREMDYLSQDELNRRLQLYFVDKSSRPLKELGEQLKLRLEGNSLPRAMTDWADRKGWLGFEESDSEVVFLAPWFRDDYLEEAERQFAKSARLIIVSQSGLNLIRHLAGIEGRSREPSRSTPGGTPSIERIVVGENPYAMLFRDIIAAAQRERASDIHILPQRNAVDILLRVNGDLELFKSLEAEHRLSFINEVKRLCGFSISISGEAQDGRISFPAKRLDVRTSLLPAHFGEKIVLRLLDQAREFDLARSPLPERAKEDLLCSLKAQNGVVIVSGPTGSGKTTLLNSLLCSLDRKRKNVITLEDPIEYTIEGITQVGVTPKLSFGQALRSVLRQDPDVILVGEIRDQETAELCMKAASTGHLVLSTLHANSAAEVVTRLIHLGVDPYLVKSCLRFSAAQRLVRRLCPGCSLPAQPSVRAELAATCLEKNYRVGKDANLRVQNPAGCSMPDCRRGLRGRIPVLEYLESLGIQTLVSNQQGNASRPAYTTLQACALQLAEKGEADVCEVLELG